MAFLKVIGLMSGTSLDGVDAALIETDGETIGAFGPTAFVPYVPAEQSLLRSVMGMWPGDAGLPTDAAAIVHNRHLQAISRLPPADLIGFHGQTLAHDPANGRTHQLGDGAEIARRSATRTIWDFRSEDMRKGGQGAPLVPFYHFALAKLLGMTRPVAFLNIGGVANLTWIDPAKASPEEPGALLAFDTGPGNALLNDFVLAKCGETFDAGGELAAAGLPDQRLLARWLGHDFLRAAPPKSLDRQAFHQLTKAVYDLSPRAGAATLTAFTVACITMGMRHFSQPIQEILVCGGGARNGFIMALLRENLGVTVAPVDKYGLDGDMIEAQAFAFLAARLNAGMPISAPGTTACRQPARGGKFSG